MDISAHAPTVIEDSGWLRAEMVDPKLLASTEMKMVGRLTNASNASLLVETELGINAIYKPIVGERPLWDFPEGKLANREVAAYLVSELGNFHLVPTTVLRDGPFGYGSVQVWIESEELGDLAELAESEDLGLRRLALFDAVINNADRKFGHILKLGEKYLGCDHGTSFHEENKLRTVLWQFRSQKLNDEEIKILTDLLEKLSEQSSDLATQISSLILAGEYQALLTRIKNLLSAAVFPEPSPDWPAIPWPPV